MKNLLKIDIKRAAQITYMALLAFVLVGFPIKGILAFIALDCGTGLIYIASAAGVAVMSYLDKDVKKMITAEFFRLVIMWEGYKAKRNAGR